jgi:hypothetical protein
VAVVAVETMTAPRQAVAVLVVCDQLLLQLVAVEV